ncbi:hypothetical protein [Sandarakinorhabdus sp.]|uniref:hypothetical protein n=1 Tax=Sandarakinorhabdus sp. TaxID=1916663 RepID=UPI003341C5BF
MRLFVPALIAAALASAAAAQSPPPAPAPAAQSGAGQRLMAADANKDGKWSKDEWLAAGRREMGFGLLDGDKDGFVSRAELTEGMKRMRAMGMAPPPE